MTETTYRATVLIPTHNRAKTLRLAVASALAQTVSEIEVIIIGDGVTDPVRVAARALVRSDSRVVFLDRPKSAHHGEEYRHEAIVTARSNAIFYLCDDDLLMPAHVEDLLVLLKRCNFVQSLNGFVSASGDIGFYPADLSDPSTIAMHLVVDKPYFYNAVSLTGTAHARDFYLELNRPWETTPTGRWPDHYQWCKMFVRPDLRAATSERMTALQFPTSADGRDTLSEKERFTEMMRWARIVASPHGQAQIDALVSASAPLQMERDRKTIFELSVALHSSQEQLRFMSQTLPWLITSPLRFIRALTKRRR
jgi:hypothetical protein